MEKRKFWAAIAAMVLYGLVGAVLVAGPMVTQTQGGAEAGWLILAGVLMVAVSAASTSCLAIASDVGKWDIS